MKIGIIKERIFPEDRRVAFSPDLLLKIKDVYPDVTIAIESSDIRQYPDSSYIALGFDVTTDLSDCDILFGVKEVPIEFLIPNKKYLFFSHTIKAQKNNRKLLQAIIKNNIELYDYEGVTDNNGKRLIGFGNYAGLVGAYNALQLFGLKFDLYKLPKACNLKDKTVLFQKIKRHFLPPIKIVVTGKGRVSEGVRELFKEKKIKEVTPENFLNKNFSEPVFTVLESKDYFKRSDNSPFDKNEFYQYPEKYESNFERFAQVADIYISGHFQSKDAPVIVSQEMLRSVSNSIKIVADISCDFDGSIACSIQKSSIEKPFYGYLPYNNEIVDVFHPGAIAVMSISNLPCELAKDASDGFGEMLFNTILPALLEEREDELLTNARVTINGKLTKKYSYLTSYIAGNDD